MSAAVTTPPSRRPRTGSHAAARERWLERLARFPDSGLTPAQFCALEDVSLPSFYAWRRRLAAEDRAAASPHQPARDPGPRLLPVRLPPPAPAVELVLPAGAVLRLPHGCDLDWVRALVAALGGAPC